MSDYDPDSPTTIPMASPDSGVDSAIYAAKLRAENADLRATVERLTREAAALRLMLREVASTNSTGIDYALRCQRERDTALRWSRLWHAEARRLWREVAALTEQMEDERLERAEYSR